ncbi:hypothetical protein ACPW90_002755 [Providencia rettgeri]|uniref:hypothetical protein n=1 Tax=unclassified Providencia TaxID=2633465 RepID=UPI001BD5DF8B|nr:MULTISPECIES: hypothetical protein [unclassified Providencia]EJD6378618.1 hypothetical protein [Providencia rettgeri]ELR5116258.1 hypothetical protein [Providencia rettgeri]HBK4773209.1 hypothetical protein [Providencia rettgeri]HEF8781962.1 hypothetical protein [Providencia rettgeri]
MSSIPVSSDRQSAVRLLACINAGSIDVTDDTWGTDIVAILRTQLRLQALDFWMRNPDYLANELITEFELNGEQSNLELAKNILDSQEPDLRRVPMIRYRFGAFEPLDNALSILRAADFIRIKRQGSPGHIQEHIYLLTQSGRDAMDELSNLAEEISWYKQRADVVARLAGGSGGKALKDRQYLQAEYADTELNHIISPITDRVRSRLEAILQGNKA